VARLRHIVLFTLRETARGGEVQHVLHALKELEQLPGILEWRAERSLDGRKGPLVALNALFESEESFASYRADVRHVSATATLSILSDWLVADYLE
jgi:hypothetical protein